MKKFFVVFLIFLNILLINTSCFGASSSGSTLEGHKCRRKNSYNYDEKSHWYPCTSYMDGCTTKYYEAPHEGGEHNNGKCTICNQIYQTHNRKDKAVSCGSDKHYYECSYEGCTERFVDECKVNLYEFRSNRTHHWNPCEKKGCTNKFNEEKHSERESGICEVCNNIFDEVLIDDDYLDLSIFSGTLKVKFLELKKGEKKKLTYKYNKSTVDPNIVWKSSNSNVVTVNNGEIEAIRNGEAIITVTDNVLNKTATCEILVGEETFKILASKTAGAFSEITVDKGKVYGVDVFGGEKWYLSVKPSKDIEWSTDNNFIEIKEEGGNVFFEVPKDACYGNLGVYETIITAYKKDNRNRKAKIQINFKHTGGEEHESNGRCKNCGSKYVTHRLKSEYFYDKDQHWRICYSEYCKDKKFDDTGKIMDDSSENGHNLNAKNECSICEFKDSISTTEEEKKIKPGPEREKEAGEGTEWEWRFNEDRHWKLSLITGENSALERHTESYFLGGTCETCGRSTNSGCNHTAYTETYMLSSEEIDSLDNGKHSVICNGCKQVIGLEKHDRGFRQVTYGDVMDEAFINNSLETAEIGYTVIYCKKCDAVWNGKEWKVELGEETEFDFYIPTKVYYLEEGKDISISYNASIDKKMREESVDEDKYSEPDEEKGYILYLGKEEFDKFTWTVDTIISNEYEKENGDFGGTASAGSDKSSFYKIFDSSSTDKEKNTSDDGTFRFQYSPGIGNSGKYGIGEFKITLRKDAIEQISHETNIRITAHSKSGKASYTQTIKLIKLGAPKSICRIYPERTMYKEDEEYIVFNIRTEYPDFSSNQIKSSSETEFPLYEVFNISNIVILKEDGTEITDPMKNNTIKKEKIKLGDAGNISFDVKGEKFSIKGAKVEKAEDFRGYKVLIKIEPHMLGAQKIKILLETEYKYKTHQNVKKERIYTGDIIIVGKDAKIEKNKVPEEGTLPLPDEVKKTPSKGGALAGFGLIFLLIVAFILWRYTTGGRH